MCKECGCSLQTPTQVSLEEEKKVLEVFEDILKHNQEYAKHNREHFEKYNIFSINLMSSPGAGKTTLLEKTINSLKNTFKIGVIEGDLETEKDAERIRKTGVPVYQITTGTACHLDAILVHKALHHLPLKDIDLLFIENVGNLVCPANYDLGTHLNITLLSIPEGDDKPEKYPLAFKNSQLVLITKIDLLPYFEFDVEKVKESIKKINPSAEIVMLSAKTGEGFENWINFITKQINNSKTS